MLRAKVFFCAILLAFCLVAIASADDDDRSLLGCFTGLNRCSEWSSWFSSRYMDSCNDYCVKGGI